MAVTEAEVRADVIGLGTISFTLDLSSKALDREMPINTFRELDRVTHLLLLSTIHEFERALSTRFEAEIRISDGTVSPGSLKYEKGQIVVSGPKLAAIICALNIIMHYNDLRENVIQIYSDISAVVQMVQPPAKIANLNFRPADPDHVIAELEPFLPSRVQTIVRKRRS